MLAMNLISTVIPEEPKVEEGSYRLEKEILGRLRMTENINSIIYCYI
jgi:hypothetical protein